MLFQFFASSPDINTKRISQAVQISRDLNPCRRNGIVKRKLKNPPPSTCVSAAKLPRRKSTKKKETESQKWKKEKDSLWSCLLNQKRNIPLILSEFCCITRLFPGAVFFNESDFIILNEITLGKMKHLKTLIISLENTWLSRLSHWLTSTKIKIVLHILSVKSLGFLVC